MDTKSFNEQNFEESRAVCERIEREDGGGRVVLTDREWQILDMWPKFEDGEYVWFGDDVSEIDARSFVFLESGAMVTNLTSAPAYGKFLRCREPLKHPAPKVLDADGVEIKVGDTVYAPRMYGDNSFTVSRFAKNCKGETLVMVDEMGSGLPPLTVTHTRPDSWERLEEDALKDVCEYAEASSFGHIDASDCDTCRFYNEGDDLSCEEKMASDIIRRAKALAGAEE